MRKLWKFSPLILAIGCSYSEPQIEVVEVTKIIEVDMTSYEYEYYSGHNAAVAQFGSQYPDLLVDLTNKKIASYVSDSDRQGYADGYHKALDIISNRQNPQCPDLHQENNMRIIEIGMELGIPEEIGDDIESIVNYLNNMLYTDPEFFGDFGSENIKQISDEDGNLIYHSQFL